MSTTALEHLYNWRRFGRDNFHSLLFNLFQKADWTNRTKLAKGFPEEYEAWLSWNGSSSEAEFFLKHNFIWP